MYRCCVTWSSGAEQGQSLLWLSLPSQRRVCYTVVGVEALRIKSDQTPLALTWVPCPKLSPWFLKLIVSFLGVCSCLFFFSIFKILQMQGFFKICGLIEFKDFCISHVVYYFESINRVQTHLKTKPDLHLFWDFHILFVLRGNSNTWKWAIDTKWNQYIWCRV